MGAEYLSYVKFIATFAPTFFGYIISVLDSVTVYILLLRKHRFSVKPSRLLLVHSMHYLRVLAVVKFFFGWHVELG